MVLRRAIREKRWRHDNVRKRALRGEVLESRRLLTVVANLQAIADFDEQAKSIGERISAANQLLNDSGADLPFINQTLADFASLAAQTDTLFDAFANTLGATIVDTGDANAKIDALVNNAATRLPGLQLLTNTNDELIFRYSRSLGSPSLTASDTGDVTFVGEDYLSGFADFGFTTSAQATAGSFELTFGAKDVDGAPGVEFFVEAGELLKDFQASATLAINADVGVNVLDLPFGIEVGGQIQVQIDNLSVALDGGADGVLVATDFSNVTELAGATEVNVAGSITLKGLFSATALETEFVEWGADATWNIASPSGVQSPSVGSLDFDPSEAKLVSPATFGQKLVESVIDDDLFGIGDQFGVDLGNIVDTVNVAKELIGIVQTVSGAISLGTQNDAINPTSSAQSARTSNLDQSFFDFASDPATIIAFARGQDVDLITYRVDETSIGGGINFNQDIPLASFPIIPVLPVLEFRLSGTVELQADATYRFLAGLSTKGVYVGTAEQDTGFKFSIDTGGGVKAALSVIGFPDLPLAEGLVGIGGTVELDTRLNPEPDNRLFLSEAGVADIASTSDLGDWLAERFQVVSSASGDFLLGMHLETAGGIVADILPDEFLDAADQFSEATGISIPSIIEAGTRVVEVIGCNPVTKPVTDFLGQITGSESVCEDIVETGVKLTFGQYLSIVNEVARTIGVDSGEDLTRSRSDAPSFTISDLRPEDGIINVVSTSLGELEGFWKWTYPLLETPKAFGPDDVNESAKNPSDDPALDIIRLFITDDSSEREESFTMLIEATEADNVVQISQSGGLLSITRTTTFPNGTTESDPLRQIDLTETPIDSIRVNLKGGDDQLLVDESVSIPFTVFAGTGDDVVITGGGEDYIDVGTGDFDFASGGAGNDRLIAGGIATLNGDGGNDVLLAGPSGATLNGGDDNDRLVGGPGDDQLNGGKGQDSIYGNAGNDSILGGEGNDVIEGGSGRDSIAGGLDDDIIVAGADNDIIFWLKGDGRDDIDGGSGTDGVAVVGTDEVDRFSVSANEFGNAIIDRDNDNQGVIVSDLETVGIALGRGSDDVSVADSNRSQIALLAVFAGPDDGDTDSLTVQATNLDETIHIVPSQVGSGGVLLKGLTFDIEYNELTATDDHLNLFAGAGNDRILVENLSVSPVLNLAGEAGSDELRGGPGDDSLSGGPGEDILIGGAGNDTINGGDGFDTILVEGTAADDVITVNQVNASTLVHVVNGDSQSDTISAIEQVRVDAGDGDDLIAISVDDSLVASADDSLRFDVLGGGPNASDRLVVRDDGLGDLVVHREATDGRSGSVSVGPLAPVDYSGIETVSITPLDSANGSTGEDNLGRLIVFKPDPFEHNESRLNSAFLGSQLVSLGNLSITPGAVTLPAPFGEIAGDEDWFEFRSEKIGTFRFEVLFSQIESLANGRDGLPGDGNLDIGVFNADGLLIADSSSLTDNESLDISMAADTSYYLRVDGVADAINVYNLVVSEVDLLGPRVTDVNITGIEYDLFDPKPSVDGPTPPVQSITVSLEDLYARAPGDLYPAIDAAVASNPGNYLLIGDQTGIVPITEVLITNQAPQEGVIPSATIELRFADFLRDDRYTLRLADSILDPAGNALDGESNASAPLDDPHFPSGNGISGGDFVARFTVDSRPEIATWSQGVVYADINGNTVWDPEGQDNDATNRDFVFNFGEVTDAYFTGNFAANALPGADGMLGTADDVPISPNDAASSGFDKLGAYGAFNGQYQFFLDTDDDGVGDYVGAMAYQVNAIPVAGNFYHSDADAAAIADGKRPRDEIGAFDGTHWYLDVNGNNRIDFGERFESSLRGIPLVGDFNGDGFDDLATYNNDSGVFYFDLDADGDVDDQLYFGFSGFGERPVTGDVNLDGIDDLVMWVPKQDGQLPKESGEFHFLVSDNVMIDVRPDTRTGYPMLVLPSDVFDPYSPEPLGNDLIAQFGDDFALPLLGNFDPPVTRGDGAPSFAGALTNALNPLDTTGEGLVTARDALVIINALGRVDFQPTDNALRVLASLGGYRLDVTQDARITALDALRVINALGEPSGGSGEAEASGSLVADWASQADQAIADLDDDEDDLLSLLAVDSSQIF